MAAAPAALATWSAAPESSASRLAARGRVLVVGLAVVVLATTRRPARGTDDAARPRSAAGRPGPRPRGGRCRRRSTTRELSTSSDRGPRRPRRRRRQGRDLGRAVGTRAAPSRRDGGRRDGVAARQPRSRPRATATSCAATAVDRLGEVVAVGTGTVDGEPVTVVRRGPARHRRRRVASCSSAAGCAGRCEPVSL